MKDATLRTVKEIYAQPDQFYNKTITLSGWIRSNRNSKVFGFIELNDGTFFKNIQLVYEEQNLNDFKEITKLGVGTAIYARGVLVETPEAKQPFELKVESIEVEGACPSDYPLQKKRHSFEFLRTIAHLRPRTNTFSAVFRVRSLLAYAIHKFFQERDFVYVHTPIITGSDAEGAGEMFQVTTFDLKNVPLTEDGQVDFKEDFFGRETNLTVSGQLNAEAYALAFQKGVYFRPHLQG